MRILYTLSHLWDVCMAIVVLSFAGQDSRFTGRPTRFQ